MFRPIRARVTKRRAPSVNNNNSKMFKRKHVKLGKRKSKVSIDLNSLTKKDRKAYRQQKNDRSKGKRKDKSEEEEADDEDQEDVTTKTFPPSSSASEDEDDDHDAGADAYRQLVSNLGIAGTKSHKDSDEDESEEEEEEDDEGDVEEATEDVAGVGMEEEDVAGAGVQGSESEAEGSGDEEGDTSDEEEEDIEEEDDDDVEAEDDTLQESDPFMQHFERDLDDQVAEELAACHTCHREETKISGVGTAVYLWPHDKLKEKKAHKKNKALTSLHVKKSLLSNLVTVNRNICKSKTGEHDGLTSFQHSLFSVLNNYQDLLYTSRTADNGDQIRQMYCLHALNHILKTRKQVISHNVKLKAKPDTAGDETYRDQGLTRPKVLIVCPFRESAKMVVQTFIQLLNPTDQSFVANKKRFNKEYSLPPEEEPFKGHKPEDFEATFEGNIDDHFRIGVGVARKTLKLYTKFYAADIIVASPLGLRTLIGTDEDAERDYDFLNSIELLVLDQADVFMMQNWDHILHLLQHLHLQPQQSHGVDFSRVRMWTINGWSRYYRQTLLFSSVPLPEINSVFNRHCYNYAGKFHVQREPTAGTICQIATQLPQVFHRIDCSSHPKMADERFEYFVKKILPHHLETLMSNTLVFLPSYFDFVRLRNYLIREGITAIFVNEYSKDMAVSKARAKFFHRKIPFMLYTERYHFFRRVSIRGICHLVFYGLPMYPHLYAEMCNMLQDKKTGRQAENQTCTVLYTRYEAAKLAEMVGTDRATQMINSKKAVHMFVTGENG